MIAGEYFAPQTQLATVVAPVAIYFLILGLLNSRRHPQTITARQDVLLLTAALSPLLILPLAGYVSSAALIVIVVLLAAMALVAFTFGPAGGSYVVYNLTHRQALRAIERTLDQLGLSYQTAGHRIQLDEGGATIDISSFSLLRNVSIRIRHANPELSRKLRRRPFGRGRKDRGADRPRWPSACSSSPPLCSWPRRSPWSTAPPKSCESSPTCCIDPAAGLHRERPSPAGVFEELICGFECARPVWAFFPAAIWVAGEPRA